MIWEKQRNGNNIYSLNRIYILFICGFIHWVWWQFSFHYRSAQAWIARDFVFQVLLLRKSILGIQKGWSYSRGVFKKPCQRSKIEFLQLSTIFARKAPSNMLDRDLKTALLFLSILCIRIIKECSCCYIIELLYIYFCLPVFSCVFVCVCIWVYVRSSFVSFDSNL